MMRRIREIRRITVDVQQKGFGRKLKDACQGSMDDAVPGFGIRGRYLEGIRGNSRIESESVA